MKIAILGFGREGESVLGFLQNAPQFRGAEIWILDKNPGVKAPLGVKKQLGKGYLKNLRRFDLIFRSPGVPYNLPKLVKARRMGVWLSSATKLFFEEISRLKPKTSRLKPCIIGITGTKGKGTTATMLYEILKASSRRGYLRHNSIRRGSRQAILADRQVFLAGNIGNTALDILPRLLSSVKDGKPYVVLELSSFQLQDLSQSPDIAVVLDVFPDHQDSHLNLREYYAAKSNIAKHQTPSGKVFFFGDNPKSMSTAKIGRGKKIAVYPNKFNLFKPADLKIPGAHNFRNAVMAATVATRLGIPKSIVKETIRGFGGMKHRLEFAGNVAGVAFYNDSASTNPQTSAAAILAFPRQPKILIAGGQDKGLDYKPLAKALRGSGTKLVALFGENKNKIAASIGKRAPVELADTLEEAVKMAKDRARIGSVVLFSPGAASFDQFNNYEDRGEKFKKIVKGLQ